jgi:peptidoglycan hydrolase-like protein with peptidoglycan-binding domain/3D (Asp-Asp-Asp) domain-containing protein
MIRFSSITNRLFTLFLSAILLNIFIAVPIAYSQEIEEVVEAEKVPPYKDTFLITGYYSPLPGQTRYVTGTYEGDIRLNGSGVHSADGSLVYSGMVAAPRAFPFGTKIEFPELGIGTVHDRGGAIKNQRLDIWMGYGEEGMARALWWGFREVEATVHGVVPEMADTLDFSEVPLARTAGVLADSRYFKRSLGLQDNGPDVVDLQRFLQQLGYYNGSITDLYDENIVAAILDFQLKENVIDSIADPGAGYFGPKTRQALERLIDFEAPLEADISKTAFNGGLTRGDKGYKVELLQKELARLNFLRIEATGFYGEITEHAVFKFQQARGIVKSFEDDGAGYFGPKTRTHMNGIISSRENYVSRIAKATERYRAVATQIEEESTEEKSEQVQVAVILEKGNTGTEVRELQEMLQKLGFFEGNLTSDYFGDVTKSSLIKFQKAHGVIVDGSEIDAGVYNEKTRNVLEQVLGIS